MMGDISKHFDRREFSCKCGCGFSKPHPDLISALQMARNALGRPIIINSGCRCAVHNNRVGGSKGSSHVKGLAADISCKFPSDRWELLDALKMVGFTRFGVAHSFLHVDVDTSKPQNCVWVY